MPDGNDPRDLSSADAFGLPPSSQVFGSCADRLDTQEPEGDTPQIPGRIRRLSFRPFLAPASATAVQAVQPRFPGRLLRRDLPSQGSLRPLVGTLRIDRGAPEAGPDGVIVSGDLYLGAPPWVVHPDATATAGSVAATVSRGDPPFELLPIQRIPIYPRNRYHSYLSGTRLFVPAFTIGNRPCQVTIDVDQYDYTSRPPGRSKVLPGVAEPEPALRRAPGLATVPPAGHRRASLQGRVFQGTVDRGSITLTWVSSYLRRAVLEIDVLTGAVALARSRTPREQAPSTSTQSSPAPAGTSPSWRTRSTFRCRQVWIRTSAGQAATSTT